MQIVQNKVEVKLTFFLLEMAIIRSFQKKRQQFFFNCYVYSQIHQQKSC